MKISRNRIINLYIYFVAFLVIASTRTVWLYDYSNNMNTNRISILISGLMLMGIFINGNALRIKKSEVKDIALVSTLLLIYVMLTSRNRFLFSYMYALPLSLSVFYFMSLKEPYRFWIAFKNVVVALAIISLIFFIGGTELGIIPPTRTATFEWAYTRTCRSFYDIYYEAQRLKTGGSFIQRNTGIFVEAPMYSFVLSVALGIELFINNKSKVSTCMILVVTIITSFSTTGYLAIILLVVLYYAGKTLNTKKMTTKKIILIIAVMVACIAAFSIVGDKSTTLSGEASTTVRIDHVFACFRAFLSNPIIGTGYANTEAVLKYANSRQGISVGLPYLLASGGLVLTLILLMPLLRKAKEALGSRNFNFLFWEFSIIFLYFFTAITSAPLFPILNGFMYVNTRRLESEDQNQLDL